MATKSEVIVYTKSLVGGGVDYDGWYGFQCVDLPAHLMQKFWNFTPWGDAIDYMSNKIPSNFKRYRKGEAQIQPGDFPIWKWGSWDIYGHIGVCTAVNGRSITSIEQNVDGAPVGVGGPARVQTRLDDCLVGFIRPYYVADPEGDKQVVEHNWTRVPETGTYTQTLDADVYIRTGPGRNFPYRKDKDGKPVFYTKGDKFKYDSYVIADGYVWISYIGAQSKQRNYVATGEHNGQTRINGVWGEFKA